MSLLVFENISKSYGDKLALDELSLEIHDGEVFGLLGPNGAGKTTLIRILMDIIRADSGVIQLFGKPYPSELLTRVSYLPEERGLYRKQKVLDVMTYFGTLRGMQRREARGRALDWLERVGLSEVAGWRVEQLSKGMSQKVQIASTLLCDPDLCVLDEPFSGLDPVNLRLVQELIRERKENGQTTILSTHQMNMVETLCDRVGLIHRGRLMVYGDVAEVRRRFSLPEVRVELDGALPELAEVEKAVRENPQTWRLLLKDGFRADQLLHSLVENGALVNRFERVLAPLEDVFVRVVQEEAA